MAAKAAIILILSCVSTTNLFADIPSRPENASFVNDYTGLLSAQQLNELETKLSTFCDTTSNEIVVVIVPTLDGMESSEYAIELHQKWGIGKAGTDNGIVILVKPKTEDESGDVFISVGYGLEGAIPDLTSSQIVQNEMIPNFIEEDYYSAINNACDVLMKLASGEINCEDYNSSSNDEDDWGFWVLLGIIIMLFVVGAAGGSKKGGSRGGSGGSSYSGGYSGGSIYSGGYSSGRSYGGGSTGGAGAGGKW